MKKLLLVIFLIIINKAFNDNDLVENVKHNGKSFYLYDFNSGLFGKAKRKDMYCEGSFCMQRKKFVLVEQKDSKLAYEYRNVSTRYVISQCAPSLKAKVKH